MLGNFNLSPILPLWKDRSVLAVRDRNTCRIPIGLGCCLTSDLLENVPLFKYCKPGLQDSLLIALKRNTYDPGSHIVNEGDAGKGIFFISQGNIEIVRDSQPVGMLQSGDYFGHMSMLLKEQRTASVVATTYCETFELSESAYSQVQQSYPELRDAMKKMSSEASEKQASLMLEGVVL